MLQNVELRRYALLIFASNIADMTRFVKAEWCNYHDNHKISIGNFFIIFKKKVLYAYF